MKILGIDGSGLVASVAIVADDILLAEYTTDFMKTHSQTLLPMLSEIKTMTELDLEELDAIAVAAGPGSFTGLRIASATAKGLGLAMDKPIVAVPTVDAMAYNLFGCSDYICPIMDARRGQVYTGIYHFEENQMVCDLEQCAIAFEELADCLNGFENEKKVCFLGDGVPVFADKISALVNKKTYFAPANSNRQRAASVASLGALLFEEGKCVSSDDFRPDYLRLSQAERERQEKNVGC